MTEMIRRFLGQRLGSVGLWIALAALAILAALPLTTGRSAGVTTALAAFVIAGGIVSRDAASGALQMIVARPILRAEYLFGRYFGALSLFAGYLLATLLIAFGLDRTAVLAGWSGGGTFSWSAALTILAQELPEGVLEIAMILFFSTFLRGIGDGLAFLLFLFVVSLIPQIGMQLGNAGVASFGRFLADNLVPDGPWESVFRDRQSIWQASTGRWALAVVGYLLAATWIFNRREFSYGQD